MSWLSKFLFVYICVPAKYTESDFSSLNCLKAGIALVIVLAGEAEGGCLSKKHTHKNHEIKDALV